jgi:hypothetical protein
MLSAGGARLDTTGELPGEIVLFDEALAREVRDLLGEPTVQVTVAPPFAPFEELFTSLFETLTPKRPPTIPLSDTALAALCAVSDRLWRAKPWQYAFDHPVIEVRSPQLGEQPLYASVLGANREVFGVALYSSVADYTRDAMQGALREVAEAALGTADDAVIDAELGLDPERYARGGGRTTLLSFDPKDEMHPDYRSQLARAGWSRRLSMVPTFIGRGGDQEMGDITEEEAQAMALAVDAVVTFCERHEDQITDEDFPIADTVETVRDGARVTVTLAMPPERRARRRARSRR